MSKRNTILTPIEQSILAFVPRGLTNEEIAKELCVSVNTVKMHLYQICIKLNANTRAQAFLTAIQQNYIDLHDTFSKDELVELLAITIDYTEPIFKKFVISLPPEENSTDTRSEPSASQKSESKQSNYVFGQHMPPILAEYIRLSQTKQHSENKRKTSLSNEERVILALAARGLTNKEMADLLSLSTSKM